MMLRDLRFGNKWDEHPRWLVLDDSTSCKLKHLGFFDQWKISGDGDDSGWWYDGMSCSFSPNFVQKRCPPILLTWAMKLPKLPLFYHRGFRKSPDFLPQKLPLKNTSPVHTTLMVPVWCGFFRAPTEATLNRVLRMNSPPWQNMHKNPRDSKWWESWIFFRSCRWIH